MDSMLHLQLCEFGQLQAFNRKVSQSVPAQSEDLQTPGEILKCPELQMNDLITAQVPTEMKYHPSNYEATQCCKEKHRCSRLYLFEGESKNECVSYRSLICNPGGKQCSLNSVMSLLLKSRVSRAEKFCRRLPSSLRILL